jgi:hypothetical protein
LQDQRAVDAVHPSVLVHISAYRMQQGVQQVRVELKDKQRINRRDCSVAIDVA